MFGIWNIFVCVEKRYRLSLSHVFFFSFHTLNNFFPLFTVFCSSLYLENYDLESTEFLSQTLGDMFDVGIHIASSLAIYRCFHVCSDCLVFFHSNPGVFSSSVQFHLGRWEHTNHSGVDHNNQVRRLWSGFSCSDKAVWLNWRKWTKCVWGCG